MASYARIFSKGRAHAARNTRRTEDSTMSVAELQAQLKIAELELKLAQVEASGIVRSGRKISGSRATRGTARKSTRTTTRKAATQDRPARKRAPFDKEKFQCSVEICKMVCGRDGLMHPQTQDREFPDADMSSEIEALADDGFKPAVRLRGALNKARRHFDEDGEVPAILYKSEWQNYQVIPAADVVVRDSDKDDDADADAESDTETDPEPTSEDDD